MTTTLSPWAWVRRALFVGAALTCAGVLAGGLGALVRPWLGMLLGGVGVALGGAAWATSRIGGAGVGAAFVGLVTSLGLSLEGWHAHLSARAAIVERPSLSSWDPRGEDVALHVGELRHLRELESWAQERRGSGKNARSVSTRVTPLFDPAEQRVVGFHCRTSTEVPRQNGRWVLSSAAWHGNGPMECGAGVALALAKCAKAGLPVADGARERFVEVFPTEAALRSAHDLQNGVCIPLTFFFAYGVLVVLFRRQGAASVA